MLYERARKLQASGLSAEEISRALLAEGARPEDISVILGSLGLGPQPQPDPSQRPLVLARRMMESRSLRFALFGLGAAAVAAAASLLWKLMAVVSGVFEGFSSGR